MEPKFMISEVFGTSWKYTKSQIWVLVGLFIGYFIKSEKKTLRRKKEFHQHGTKVSWARNKSFMGRKRNVDYKRNIY